MLNTYDKLTLFLYCCIVLGSFFLLSIKKMPKDLGQFPIQSAQILTACGLTKDNA